MTSLSIHFAPLIAWPLLIALAGLGIVLIFAASRYHKRGMVLRLIALAALLGALANPSIIREKRQAVADVAAIVVDKSPSQQQDKRMTRTKQALETLQKQAQALPGLQTRIVRIESGTDEIMHKTEIFRALSRTMADVPARRRAGVIVISDGQIHDVPARPERFADYGPFHLLLSGRRDERDRRLRMLQAPEYGIVGEKASLRLRIEDTDTINADRARVSITTPDGQKRARNMPIGQTRSIDVPIRHAGQNIFRLKVESAGDELSMANNTVALNINGVRDRLKVLLVSGEPHAGGRTWRNMLASDPGVDLIHFTILRQPEKVDDTPRSEMSLIAFPFRELFEVKLDDFDLIVFDRYRLNQILPSRYFRNIADYVRNGGALLEASGPSFASNDSIAGTAIGNILPAQPGQQVITQAYTPVLSAIGQRHPVTRPLNGKNENNGPEWGRWLRQIAVKPKRNSHVVMRGTNDQPLLMLHKVGNGRVAQLASDQIWLWARGFEGGGPQDKLLRRTAHWLMKEPSLEANTLDVQVQGKSIHVRRRKLEGDSSGTIMMTRPDGSKADITLEKGSKGWAEYRLNAEQLGVYAFKDGQDTRYAIVGNLNPPELMDLRTTPEKMKPVTGRSNGGIYWLNDALPDIRMVNRGRDYTGNGWLGLSANQDYRVTGVRRHPLTPAWLALCLIIILVTAAWLREAGRRR
jgi:hypothetical protein